MISHHDSLSLIRNSQYTPLFHHSNILYDPYINMCTLPIHYPCTLPPTHYPFIHSVVSNLLFRRGTGTSNVLMRELSSFHWILQNDMTFHDHKACGIITFLNNGIYAYKVSPDRTITTICCSITRLCLLLCYLCYTNCLHNSSIIGGRIVHQESLILVVSNEAREILARARWIAYFTRFQPPNKEIAIEFLQNLQNGQSVVRGR